MKFVRYSESLPKQYNSCFEGNYFGIQLINVYIEIFTIPQQKIQQYEVSKIIMKCFLETFQCSLNWMFLFLYNCKAFIVLNKIIRVYLLLKVDINDVI